MYYDGANWKWGHEMDEGLVTKVIADLGKIAKKIEEIQAMCKVEKKEQRKMVDIIRDRTVWIFNGTESSSTPSWETSAAAAIDAVIECYEDWVKYFVHKCNGKDNARSFPEYLKEKLGNS